MPVATYTQKGRPLIMTTPLGPDALLAVGLTGREGLSQLFSFHVDALAPRSADGKPATCRSTSCSASRYASDSNCRTDAERFFNGICARVSQGDSDDHFTNYRLEIVPRLWLLTKKAQSRIFQHLTVPDILKKVLAGFPVEFRAPGAPTHPRDFCVQYRETDFNFASRLMEEEGIYYFFKHTERLRT